MRAPLALTVACLLLSACGPDASLAVSDGDDTWEAEASQPLAAGGTTACLPQAPTPFAVFRNAYIPQSDTAAYPYFPATAYLAGERSQAQFATSAASGDKYFFQWVNRCNDGPEGGPCDSRNKGNLPELTVNQKDYRFFFTTVAKANSCTVAQLNQVLGLSNLGFFDGKGLRPYAGGPIAPFLTNGRFVDVCFLYAEPTLAAHVDGVALDYEPQDRRPAAVTKAILTRLAATIHAKGKKALLWTNRITSAGAVKNGIDASNANALVEAFDAVPLFADDTIAASNLRAELRRQQSLYAIEARHRAKLYVLTGLGTGAGAISFPALAAVRAHVIAERLAGVAVWNDGADFDGCQSLGVKQVKCLVYGHGC